MDAAEEVGVVVQQRAPGGLSSSSGPVARRREGVQHRVAVAGSPTREVPSSAVLLRLQVLAGNRAVSAVLQRQTGPTPVGKDVPGLPEHVLGDVERHLVAGSAAGAQAAIDLVVGVLVARGEVDLSLVEGRRMRFDPTLTDEGHTRQWARPARGGGFHPLPSTVRIGPPALVNAAWLYSAIIHEYRHAEAFQVARSDPFKEVDAYLHNIERADEAGLDGGEVLELWSRLGDEWADVPEHLRPLYAERYAAAGTTVRRIAGTAAPAVQRAPSADECPVGATVLVDAARPGASRCITEDDPEFRANYIDNNIVLATGPCLPGTTWATIDHASVPTIVLTYRDGRTLEVPVADVPLRGASRGRDNRWVSASRPLARYERRGDGFIYPVREAGPTSYVAYGDTTNIVSLRAGLHETIEELQTLFTLMELGVTFAGAVAALGGSLSPSRGAPPARARITSLGAPNTGGRIRFRPQSGGGTAAPRRPSEGLPAVGRPTTSPTTRQRPPGGGSEPSHKAQQGKARTAKAGKRGEGAPDRRLTSDKPEKAAKGKKPAKGAASGEKRTDEQTAAERDWDKADAEARRQRDAADKPATTEHGALREQQRGALTAADRGRLDAALPRTQGDGATVKVARQKGGGYVVHVTNADGQTVTLMRDKSRAEVQRLSENYGWTPPFDD